MNKVPVSLVEDWQHFYKWSSVRWQAFCAAAIETLAWIVAHWPALQAVLQHVFRGVTPETWEAIGQLLVQVAPTQDQAHTMAGALLAGTVFRVTSINRPAQP